MSIRLFSLLPYVRVDLFHQGRALFSSDEISSIGIEPGPEDRVSRMAGIGGYEWVCWKRLDRIDLGEVSIPDFEVQIGSMCYGFPIQGILGMDFLLRMRAIIDLDKLEINPAQN